MARATVAVLYTQPESVLDDIRRLMVLANFQDALDKTAETILKINISWQYYYPGCSTTPWQLEGVIQTLRGAGYERLLGAHNSTVVVDGHIGEVNNKHKLVTDRHHVPTVHLNDPPTRWVRYIPKAKMLVLDDVFRDGIYLPEIFFGKNIVHLPTVKTHVFTTTTGAMKNAFGGLLDKNRHWTHSVIHQTLVDLLAIQKEIHTGLFAVMDGTIAGDGPGPRVMRPRVKNILLASADMVAIDAIAARLMGFDPMSLDFIRLAHEAGLGVGDPAEIEIAGDDVRNVNWHFTGKEDTFASRGQKLIYWGPLKPLENVLLRSPLTPWSYLASNIYHNKYWYRFKGNRRVAWGLQTPWGELFARYGEATAAPAPAPAAVER